MHNSLTRRLIATSFMWVVSTLAIVAVLLILLFRGYIENRFEDSLQGHLEELVAAGSVDKNGHLQLNWRPSDPRFNRPYSGWYWETRSSSGVIERSKSLWKEKLPVSKTRQGTEAQLQNVVGPQDIPLLALVQEITFPQSKDPILYIVAGPLSDITKDVRAFSIQVAITLIALGTGLLLAVWFQVSFGLRPLQELKQALKEVREGKRDRLTDDYPEEVQAVVSELNGLLEHNSALLQRARTHASNLAHALKNPLTVIKNETVDGMPDVKVKSINKQTGIMAANMARYLSQARIAGNVNVIGARSDVNAVLDDIVFSMEQLHKEKEIGFSIKAENDCYFRGEAQDLEEMLGNLIDNACKWAVSKVDITVSRGNEHLLIIVEDDGCGIPESQLQAVIERGHRLDEEISGSGLGLDIVRDIAELYRGSLELDKSPAGGIQASLILPAVD